MRAFDDLYKLPENLPIPVDDGACDHLPGIWLLSVLLPSTGGDLVDLSRIRGRTVVYTYPRTGRPDQDVPPGWNDIPGARGCTPQACGFRDHHEALAALGVGVFGLSTQATEYQREAAERLRLPFPLLSDSDLVFTRGLRLPTFAVAGMILIKRLTLICSDGRIEKVFYPVFPPDKHAVEVRDWLAEHLGERGFPGALKNPFQAL